jgi:hypothetical protein
MIKCDDEKQTAKQYVNGRFESYISVILDCVGALRTDEDIMNDELFADAFYFFHTDENDLVNMTLNERKHVMRQLSKQGGRLLKIVDPKYRD